MKEPPTVIPFAIYDNDEAAAVLRIGLDKLDKLVAEGDLVPLRYTPRRRFWGEDLIALCRRSGGTAQSVGTR